jgi:predicted porin
LNKSLITLLAVVASLPVAAKTLVYGELHASFDKLRADAVDNKDSLAINGSRFGVKGSYDLNKKVSAIYQFEWGVDSRVYGAFPVGSRENAFSNRNQIIGLVGPHGAVILGRYDTPFKIVGREADLFWSSQLGQNRNITNPAVWDLRADKIIAYQSPKLHGFQGMIAYAADIGGPDSRFENSSAVSLNGFYKLKTIKLGAAYERHDLDHSNSSRDAFRLLVSYKKRPLKLVGFYQNENNALAATAQPDATVYGVGAAYKIGSGTFKGQYYSRLNESTDKDPKLMAIGYDYKIASKTDIYTQYVKVTEGQKLGGTGHGASITSTTGGDASGISFGVRHKF